MKKLATAFAAGALALTLSACSEGNGGGGNAHAQQTAANGDVFNTADVDFATAMIPHHAQALVMVDLTRGRELSPQVQHLTDQIQAAQAPEIEQMVDWLTAWGEPVPATTRDHLNSGDHGVSGHDMGGTDMPDSDMPGMMSDEQLDELDAAQGQEFEAMWLELMIAHHEGAIQMAQEEQEDGAFTEAVALAESIETSQQDEIDHMRKLLADLPS